MTHNLGLSAVLWTKDLSRALQFVDEIEAGFVQVNQCVAPRANVSYGGIKDEWTRKRVRI